jgi:hypothetical protein
MRRTLPLVVAGVLACRPAAAPEPAPPSVTGDVVADSPLRFAWPEGAHATVTERVLKKGRHATTRYRIVTQRDGEALLVYYRDFAFVDFEGLDLADPAVREQLDALERQVAGAIPPYRVAADGTWLGCGEFDAMLDGLTGILPAEDLASFRAMMANPKIRAVVDAKLRDVWQAWVEGWLGLSLGPGERHQGSSRIEIAGTVVELPYTIERLEGDGVEIRLRATSELAGDPAKAMLGALFDEIATTLQTGDGAARPDASAGMRALEVRRVHLREATLDPATLLPTRAFTRVTITVGDGTKTTESIESHEWTFDWNHGVSDDVSDGGAARAAAGTRDPARR